MNRHQRRFACWTVALAAASCTASPPADDASDGSIRCGTLTVNPSRLAGDSPIAPDSLVLCRAVRLAADSATRVYHASPTSVGWARIQVPALDTNWVSDSVPRFGSSTTYFHIVMRVQAIEVNVYIDVDASKVLGFSTAQ